MAKDYLGLKIINTLFDEKDYAFLDSIAINRTLFF